MVKVDRWKKRSERYKASVIWGNPGYPTYELTNDHGCLVASACGSHFSAATVRDFFEQLVKTAFYPGAKLDLSALDDEDALDLKTRDD